MEIGDRGRRAPRRFVEPPVDLQAALLRRGQGARGVGVMSGDAGRGGGDLRERPGVVVVGNRGAAARFGLCEGG